MLEDKADEKIMMHQGTDTDITNTTMCKINEEWHITNEKDSNRNRQVSCMQVVGVAGLSNYTTHYSAMVRINQNKTLILLKEGTPFENEVMATQY